MDSTNGSFAIFSKGLLKDRTKDLLLSLLIAIIGIIGSYLVLGKSISSGNSNAGSLYSASTHKGIPAQNESHLAVNDRYKPNQLLIQGGLFAGSIVKISNLSFDENEQYLIDYGNGIRHRMTSSTTHMRYNSPGLYLLQCFIWKEEKWKLNSSQTLIIKQNSKSAYSVL
jgi:hypothetical protein